MVLTGGVTVPAAAVRQTKGESSCIWMYIFSDRKLIASV